MQIVHFYHRNQMHKLSNHPDFSFFELAIWLHTLALSLVSVFVPILLIKSGYTIGQVIIYYLLFNAIDVPLNFAVGGLLQKIGAKRCLILGTIAVIAFFGLLGALPPQNWILLTILALLAALYDTLFWISHIYIFIEANRDHLDTGAAVGSLEGIRKFASILGPALGAFILITSGKIQLTLVSIAIFSLSIIPLFMMRHVRDIPIDKRLSFRKFFLSIKEKSDYLSRALWGVHTEAEDTLWPLFIFLTIGTLEAVAAVPTVVSLTTIFFSLLVGKLSNKHASKMIITGCIFIAFAWVLRLIFQDVTLYYATIFIIGFFSLMIALPLDRSTTEHGLEVGSLSVAIYRNVSTMSLRVFLYAILAVLVEIFKVSFLIAAIAVFLILAITLLLRPKTNTLN